MSSPDPREHEDLCGRELVAEKAHEDLTEEHDPNTWYEAQDGTHHCCREVWDEVDTDRCIWHALVADKPSEDLSAAVSEGPARLDRAILRESNLQDGVSLSKCRLQDADLRGVDLQGANLQRADIGESELVAANLCEADLRNADLGGADLLGADLVDANLGNADFGIAYLRNADLGGANLRSTHLGGADLIDADLDSANLGGANLAGAYLVDADLSDAKLVDADLDRANLGGAHLDGASLVDADLSRATLSEADLGETDLLDADLSGADLGESRLSDVTFRDANLTDANLERADCTRADLFDADLTGAKLYGAVLSDAQLNTDTEFGNHYTGDSDEPDPDKAAWTLRQLERLFRENALPGKAREAYLDRKDLRRRQYWRQAFVPGAVRQVVAAGKSGWRRFRHGAGQWLKARINGSDGADDGEVEEESDAAGEASTAAADDTEDDGDEHASTDTTSDAARANLSRWERLVATVRWAHAAGASVTTRYGERPWRVVGVSLVVIGASTVAYKLFGPLVRPPGPDDPVMVGGDLAGVVSVTPPGWLAEWLTSLYFSVVTFTTLGYGDLRPANGVARAVATVESFVGALLLALLVFVLGRRATR